MVKSKALRLWVACCLGLLGTLGDSHFKAFLFARRHIRATRTVRQANRPSVADTTAFQEVAQRRRTVANSRGTIDTQNSRPWRRSLLLSAVALIALRRSDSNAEEVPPARDETVGTIFIGRYTDPNHPGGYREISVTDNWQGDKRFVKIEGGGGRGEPALYNLKGFTQKQPAKDGTLVDTITIDFTPKGGPGNFLGVWDKDGITFVRDNNHWPKSKKK
mmetsp:Transcript_4031/g.8123  ORF Transcript_4031/g.8123 Transcript_4031/m.8123 type:complete len:218 (+) Transcript_4031:89-742(+)